MLTRYDRLLGGLLGGALGDALGAATETRTIDMIKEKWGGFVRDFVDIPDDTFARGFPKGSVTDDFSIAYATTLAIIENGGVVTQEVSEKSLIAWSEGKYGVFAGPTTRIAMAKLKGEHVKNEYDFIICDNSKASNGGAMKIGPIGLINPGNLDKAIEDTITVCKVTHNNNIAISAAAAVSAATAKAMAGDANLFDLVQAGLYGAREGYDRASKVAKRLAGPSVEKRINLAVEIALRNGDDIEKTMYDISDYIGTGLMAAEAVPAAFGLMVAAKGDAFETLVAAANCGADTDTVACIIGPVVGAQSGWKAFPEHFLPIIDEVNGYNLSETAKQLDAIIK